MKLKLIPVAVALLGLGIASYLIWPERFGFCETHDIGHGRVFCFSPLEHSVGVPLVILSTTFLAISFFAILFTRKTHKRWRVFSLIYGAIITVLLVTIPEVGLGGGGISLTFIDVRAFAIYYAIIFSVITVLVFGIMDLVIRLRAKKS